MSCEKPRSFLVLGKPQPSCSDALLQSGQGSVDLCPLFPVRDEAEASRCVDEVW